MKLLLAVLLFVNSSELIAAYRDGLDPEVLAYAAGLLREEIAAIDIQTAERPVKGGALIFGVAYRDGAASIFVIQRRSKSRKIIEIAKSAPFSFAAMSSSFEGVSIKASDNFSISLNYHGACGGGSQTYSFVERNHIWRLAGSEATSFECNEGGDDSVGSISNTRSINYLSGNVIERESRKDIDVSEIRKKYRYPIYPLSSLSIDTMPK